MANNDSATQEGATKKITKNEIEMAQISLDSGCDALSAIANAVEVLTTIEHKSDRLFSHTITRLMAHAVYLADTVKNDVGFFIEEVEKTAV